MRKIFLFLIFLFFFIQTAYSQTCETTIDGNLHCGFEVTDYEGLLNSPSLSNPDSARIYFDSIDAKLKCSEDGASYVDCIGSGGSGVSSLDDLSDVGTSTATADNILIADATGVFNANPLSVIDVTNLSSPCTDAEVLGGDGAGGVECQTDMTAGGTTDLDDLTDVGSSTATAGNILIADGTDFDSRDVTGDVTMDAVGVTTIQTNAVQGTDISIASEDHGDVMYFNGTDWVRLAAGTSGQFLKTQGTDANPVWDTGAGGATSLDGLSDVGTSTATAGNLLVADATGVFNAEQDVVMGGSLTVGGSGSYIAFPETSAPSTSASEGAVYTKDIGGQPELFYREESDGDEVQITNNGVVAAGAATLDALSDVGTSTATSGNLLIADGTDFDAKAMSGDVTIAGDGTTTVANDSHDHTNSTVTLDLDDLTDVGSSTATAGNLLLADGTDFDVRAMSGDVNIALDGITTIQQNAVQGTDISISSEDHGDILYFDGTDWERLPAGTSGQFLQTQGTDSDPQWATSSGSVTSLDDLDDVATSTAIASNILIADGTFFKARQMNLQDLADVGSSTATTGNLLIADGNDFNTRVMSGDVTITLGGITTVGDDSHSHGDSTITLDLDGLSDVGSSTATTGNILVADGNDFNTRSLTGDVTITIGGITTIQDNAVDGTDIALGSDDHGDIMYYDGTDWVRLGAGTSGQFLKTQGTDANPIWAGGGSGATALDELSDVGTSTATAGNLLVADSLGNFNAEQDVVMGGSLTVGGSGSYVAFPETTAPSTSASEGAVYTKDIGGQPELFYREESNGDEVQITSGGIVAAGAATLDGLSDVGSSTATSGNLLIADGDDFNARAMSGDVTITIGGITTVADDSHNHIITNTDAFTESELETQLSDVSNVITNNDSAGGDLTGSYPNPSVTNDSHDHSGLTLSADLDDLLDVGTSTATVGNVLIAQGDHFDSSNAFIGDYIFDLTADETAISISLSGLQTTHGFIVQDNSGTDLAFFESDGDLNLNGSQDVDYIVNLGEYAFRFSHPVFDPEEDAGLLFSSAGYQFLDLDGTAEMTFNVAGDKSTFQKSVQFGAEGDDGLLIIYSEEGVTDQTFTIGPNSNMTEDVSITLPADDGNLSSGGTGILTIDDSQVTSFTDKNGLLALEDLSDVGTSTSTTSGYVLRADGSEWEAQPMYGSSGYHEIIVNANQLIVPDSSNITLEYISSTGTGTPDFFVAEYDDSTDEAAHISIVAPDDMQSGNWLVDVYWYNASTSGSVCWNLRMLALSEGDTDDTLEKGYGSLISDVCDSVNTTEATRLVITNLTITSTELDSVAAGDDVMIQLRRNADDGSDDALGDALLRKIRIRIPTT